MKTNRFSNKSYSTIVTFWVEDLIEEMGIVVAEKIFFNIETYQNR